MDFGSKWDTKVVVGVSWGSRDESGSNPCSSGRIGLGLGLGLHHQKGGALIYSQIWGPQAFLSPFLFGGL